MYCSARASELSRILLCNSHDGSVRDAAAVTDVQLSERARATFDEVLDSNVAHPETHTPTPTQWAGTSGDVREDYTGAAARDSDLLQSERFRCCRFSREAKALMLASVNLGHSAAWSQWRPCEPLHRACQLASVSWLLPEVSVNWRGSSCAFRDQCSRLEKPHPRVQRCGGWRSQRWPSAQC